VEVVFVEPGMPTNSVAQHVALEALRRAHVSRHLFLMVLVEDGGCIKHWLRLMEDAFPMEPLERLPDVHLRGATSGSTTSQVGAEWPELASEKFVEVVLGNLPNKF
jgi:hypothetical protein